MRYYSEIPYDYTDYIKAALFGPSAIVLDEAAMVILGFFGVPLLGLSAMAGLYSLLFQTLGKARIRRVHLFRICIYSLLGFPIQLLLVNVSALLYLCGEDNLTWCKPLYGAATLAILVFPTLWLIG